MELPAGYVDLLSDELAPFGLEFAALTSDDEVTSVGFQVEPEAFVRDHRGLGIEESYGAAWPPAELWLWLRYDLDANPVEFTFEVFDLLVWAASADPELRDRLNTLDDPADHAAAVGEALAEVLRPVEAADEFWAE